MFLLLSHGLSKVDDARYMLIGLMAYESRPGEQNTMKMNEDDLPTARRPEVVQPLGHPKSCRSSL